MIPTTIRQARLVDPATGIDELSDLRIADGLIQAIGHDLAEEGDHVIDANGAILTPALIDLRACVEPVFTPGGETLDSLAQAAAAGGVGTVVIAPSDTTPIDTPEAVTALRAAARPMPVKLLIAGGATRGLEGQTLSEMGLMAESGAALISQGNRPVADADSFRNVLNYAAGFELWVASLARDTSLSRNAVATESEAAARFGFQVEPTMSERLAIDRDAALAELTGARLMVDRVSTREGLEALSRVKRRGLEVCATASIANLTLNAVDADGLDAAFRLTPPLRHEDDRRAMVEAIESGLIDAVVSDHTPMSLDEKSQPFSDAAPGSVSLETLLACMLRLVHEDELDLISALRPLTSGPADLLGLPQGRIEEGAPADLVLIDGDKPWVFEPEHSRSNRRNAAWNGRKFQGQVLMTIIDGGIVYNQKG